MGPVAWRRESERRRNPSCRALKEEKEARESRYSDNMLIS